MLKKFLSVLFCTLIVISCTVVSAAEIKAGDTAYMTYGGSVSVTKNPTYSGGITTIGRGTKVTVLEPYVIGEGNRKFHKIQLSDDTIGYILAYTTARETTPILEAGEIAEKELNKQWASSDTDKYQHAIEMTFLSDYIYGGSKTTEGKERNFYAKVPTEWVRHDRPDSLPLVAYATVHIGNQGKIGSVSGYKVFAYGLMSNHIHILIKAEKEEPNLIMKRIACSYVYWYNSKYYRNGHLFQDRFRSEPVETDEYFLTVLRYIHQNPIKAKPVDNIADNIIRITFKATP